MSGGLRGAVVAVAVAFAAPVAALAQIPALPPVPGLPPSGGNPGGNPGGEPQRPAPPPNGPGAGTGEVVSYRGNPSHTGVATDDTVFGPLTRLWTKTFKGPPNQPLIVGGKVIVNVADSDGSAGYGSRLFAYDPATGRKIWSQPTPGTYFSAPIAANGGRVFSVNFDGVVRAFDAASGAAAWSADLHVFVSEPPVAAAGLVFVNSAGGLFALSASDGAVRWKASVPIRHFNWPVLDSERVFIADGCGNAWALAQTTGQVVWSKKQANDDCGYIDKPAVVAGGRLFAPEPATNTYDAATGADGPPLPGGAPDAAAGDLGYRLGGIAVPLDGGPARWTFKDTDRRGYGGEVLAPVVAGPTVFVTGTSGSIFGLDRLTGELLSFARRPNATHNSIGGITPGMSVGAGVLVATGGLKLSAYAPVLHPAADGIDVAAGGFDLVTGSRTAVVAGLGRDLRGSVQRVELRRDEFPFRTFGPPASLRVLSDGTAYARVPIRHNTRFRFAAGRHRSPVFTIYAYPHTRPTYSRASATRGRFDVTMRADRSFRVGGHGLVLYFGHARAHRYERLGAGRMRQTGPGRARGTVTFQLVRRVGSRDTVTYCVVGLPRLGYGRNDGFQRRCGRARITFAEAFRPR
jgi:outer membrane protein assembly factor BamB